MKSKDRWSNFWGKHRGKTLVICRDCGVRRWIKNELINRAPNRKIYCWKCDMKREKEKRDEKRDKEIKIQRKKKEKMYCKDREHNYLGIYHIYWERIVYVCSKCGKEL